MNWPFIPEIKNYLVVNIYFRFQWLIFYVELLPYVHNRKTFFLVHIWF